MTQFPLFFLTACEASGDRIGASIIKALHDQYPNAQFIGVAGPLMRAAGCTAIRHQEDLAIMGLLDVLKQLAYLLKARRQIAKKALFLKPLVYIGIDAPDFNLPIEAQLKTQGIKTVHVNSPSVWAWRASRIKKIKKSVDLILTLFPFETKIYEKNNIPVKFIGHPLATLIPRDSQKISAREQLGISSEQKCLVIMPGSRTGDLKHLTPLFIQAAKICLTQMPSLLILAPMINEHCAEQFRQVLRQENAEHLSIKISIGNAPLALQASDATLIKSGTGTLEALLCKTPMVVAYKTDALTAWIVRKLIQTPYVSLPNILANRCLVPELLQQDARAENLAHECLALLNNCECSELFQAFDSIHETLQQDSAGNAAAAIIEMSNTKYTQTT